MTDAPSSIAKQSEEFKVADIRRGVASLAERLREVADRIENVADDAIGNANDPHRVLPYARAVHEIHHELESALSNSPLLRLITEAAEAEVYRTQAQAEAAES